MPVLHAEQVVDFSRDIRPILADHCYACHGPDREQRKASLRLDQPGEWTKPAGDQVIVSAGNAVESELIRRILSQDPDEVMPPPDAGLELTSNEKQLLERWVNEGAVWDRHWAFHPPQRPQVPEVDQTAWGRNPLDAFVLRVLEKKQWNPSPPADPRALIRRLSLGLTGLPPSLEEVDDFENAYSDVAYDTLVQRLLASPHFGERMALPWLDAARYADTHGYQNDGEREMWPWRDWVIHAFNLNMPFDQFTIEQLAGDLLPSPTLDQRIATGFNRNHRYNSEGGSIPKEVLTENVADRVETTFTTWLGLTLGCARCHDHKYDPFTMDDYYGVFAFFHNIPETGRAIRDGNSEPYMHAPTMRQRETLAGMRLTLKTARASMAASQPWMQEAQSEWYEDWKKTRKPLTFLAEGRSTSLSFEGSFYGQETDSAEEQPDSDELTWIEGVQGLGLRLDSAWDGVLGDIGRFNNTVPYTIALWVKPKHQKRGAIFSRIQDGVGGRGYQLVYDEGHFSYLSISQGYAGRIGVRSVRSFEPEKWYHVLVSYDASKSARGIHIYVNGVEIALEITQNNDSNPGLISDRPFLLGKSPMAPDFSGDIDELRIYKRILKPEEMLVLSEPASPRSILSSNHEEWSPRQALLVRWVFLENTSQAGVQAALRGLREAERQLQSFEDQLPTVMVMKEMDIPRKTYILNRGQYDQPGRPVDPGVPNILSPWNPDAPKNRLGFARWLVDAAHPLTARVFVNRVWYMLFGQGLVVTSEDFGVQGSPPSHPKLLDWLAVDFIDSGWDIKRLIRSIVSSAVYRQSSMVSAEALDLDPDNRWLARGPRERLPAHFVRDQLLSLAGLRVDRIGGVPVYPYQPQDLWAEMSRKTYPESQGADLYRRSLYTYFKRTVAPPLMQTFDAADRESCMVRRSKTNTPLQALAAFNAPLLVETAATLARSMPVDGLRDKEACVDALFRKILLREPSAREHSILLESYKAYQAIALDVREALLVDLEKKDLEISARFFPVFCVALGLLGLDETLVPR
ncbi:DUF1553 domain-containing protein [bacterium]|nr:DUF1553 domain-containing protein [bacterium]MDG1891946.1 DUF1553 domain-containing protein [Verrucomicrobiota bacterium]